MPLNEYDEAVDQVTEQSQNPFADVVARQVGRERTALRVQTDQAKQTPPDTAAEHQAIADHFGVPPSIVAGHFEQFKAKYDSDRTVQQLQNAPRTADWLTKNPTHAAIAQDDVQSLSTFEQILHYGRNLAGATGAGLVGGFAGLYGAEQAGAELADRLMRPSEVTKLSGLEEQEFQAWAKANNITDVDDPRSFYDYRGYWKDVASQGGDQTKAYADGLHFPDTYKQHGHPTFSVESKYSAGPGDGGTWNGETFVPSSAPPKSFAANLAVQAAGRSAVLSAIADRLRGSQDGAGLVERSIYGGAESLGQMAPALVAGAISGGVSLLTLVGLSTGGQEYAQARAQGAGPGRAAAAGTIQGLVEVGTEFIPAERLLGDLASKTGLIQTLAHQLVPELTGEQVATVLQDLNEWALLPANKEKTFADYLQERPSAAAATAISTLTAIGATTAVAHGTARLVERLGQTAAESKTVQRSPEAAQAFLDHALQDNSARTLYAPIETWETYWQGKGLDPRAVAADLTGDATAYDRARATGQDLEIPTSAYAVKIAPTEHNAFFVNELRIAPEQMNGREADAFQQAIAQEPPSTDTAAADTSPIRQNIVSQLEATGFERSTAESYATLYESAFGTLAQRAGIDPVDLFNRYGLTVQRGEAQNASDVAAVRSTGEGIDREGGAAARGVPASLTRTDLYPDARTREHFANVLDDLTERAQRVAPGVTAAELQPEFETRLSLWKEGQDAYKASGKDPIDLLKAVAQYGGIFEEEAGQAGEVRALKDGLKFGRAQGVANVFRGKRVLGDNATTVTGLSLDEMATRLQQDPRFAWIESPQMLWDALDDAIRHPIESDLPDAKELAQTLGMSPDRAWWKAEGSDATDTGGDTSFNVDEFNQRPSFGQVEQFARTQAMQAGGVQRLVDAIAPDARDLFGSEDAAVKQLQAALTGGAIEPSSTVGLFLNRYGVRLGQQRNGGGEFFSVNRGKISFGADRQFNIALLDNADLSTFAHESAHFWLEVMRDLAPQSETIAKDLETIRAEFGDDNTDQHEGFASSFEQYLLEGKAPSAELRSVFARFRAWLVGVYRSLQGLNVTLSPEVRQVFDRLLASDDAIQQAEAEGHVSPLFTDAQSAGMTPEQFEKYRTLVADASQKARTQLEDRALRDVQRERTAWWSAEKETVQQQVEADLSAQPVYVALNAIRNGIPVEGGEPTPIKISKASLDGYDKETLTGLRRHDAYRVDGGVHVELVAETLGFSSGDELVQALKSAAPYKQAVEQETQRRMVATHGDLLLDGRIADAAQEAVFTHRDQVVQAELKALTAGIAKGVIPPMSVITAEAGRRIGATTYRNLRPGLYLMAAQRASAKAFDLLSTNADRVGAVQAKQQELVNLALYREALAARDRIDRAVEYLRSFDTAKTRERIGKAGGDYLEQIDGLRDRYDLAKVTQQTIDRRAALREWAQQQEAKTGIPVDLPPEILNDARRVNYQSATVDELQGLRDGVKMIAHLASLKNRLLKLADKRELTETVGELVGSMGLYGKPPKGQKLEVRLPGDQAARNAAMAYASHIKLNSFIRQLDGFKDGGAMWEHIMRPINDAANLEAQRNADASRALHELFDVYRGEERTLYKKTFIPAIGDSLSKMGRLMVALNWGNEGNRDRVLSDRARKWKPEQVQAILDTLDERDWKFVQSVWDTIGSYWPEIAAKQKRVTGVEPGRVEPTPVQTRYGLFKGGYFPIAYEGWLSATSRGHVDADLADGLKRAAYTQATTKRGHVEARVQHNDEPLRLDFGVIPEHLTQVIHDLTHHETLIDVSRLLKQRDVADTIQEKIGVAGHDQIKRAIRDVAFGTTAPPDWFRAMNYVRQGVVVAKLGANVVTTALQPFQALTALPRVGLGHLAKAYVTWGQNAAHMESTVGWIRDRSSFMQTRGLTQFREINEMRNRIGLDSGRISGWLHDALQKLHVPTDVMPGIADSYFYLIQKGQQLADVPVWLAAYEKALGEVADEDRAVALADQTVIDTQGSGHIKDLSNVERTNALKILTTFYSFQNLLLNQTNEAVKKTNFKSLRSVGRLGIDAFVLLFLGRVIETQIRSALGHGGAGDDDDSILEQVLRGGASELAGMFVGLREAQGPIEGYDYTGSAGLGFFADLAKLGKQAGQGEFDSAFWRSLNQVGGDLFHYPATQVQRTAEGLLAMMGHKTSNPVVLLTGPDRKAASR